MSTTTPTPTPASAGASAVRTKPVWRWRVVDIVVASVIGVAAGLIFMAWGVGYLGPKALLEPLLPGMQGLLDGPWLFAGVLGALIIRKPGAAIYTELLAAHPERAVEKAIRGMLPKNSLARQQMSKLKVYAGPEHPHAAQQPQAYEITKIAQ